jgi:hypothetical protein
MVSVGFGLLLNALDNSTRSAHSNCEPAGSFRGGTFSIDERCQIKWSDSKISAPTSLIRFLYAHFMSSLSTLKVAEEMAII